MKRSTVITIAAIAASSGIAFAGSFDAEYQQRIGAGTVHIDNTGSGGFVNQSFSAGHLEFEYVGAGQRGAGQFSGGTFRTF